VITAVKNSTLIDNVILATTTNSCDDELTSSGIRMGIRVFRGSENDVLGRFVGALEGENADIVIRQTADDPLLDPIVIDKVIKVFLHGDCDYASNILTRTWPRVLTPRCLVAMLLIGHTVKVCCQSTVSMLLFI